jgi:uncharacterized protein
MLEDHHDVQTNKKGKYVPPGQRAVFRGVDVHARIGPPRVPSAPVRTCIGCQQRSYPGDLVRMVLGPDASVAFDLAGGAIGRGAWVHPSEACLRKAAKATARSLRADGSVDVDALMLSLAAAAVRRTVGLLGAAHRARHMAMGGDACREAFAEGRARLVILATDAKAAKDKAWLDAAATAGLLARWSTKAELGAIVGREELAVMVVTDDGLAQNLLRVMAMTMPVASRLAKANCDATAAAVSARTTGSQGRQDSEDG